jgi:hypothetical protein
MSFTEKLAVGRLGEDAISRWLIRKKFFVLPAYEIMVHHGKGPRLFGPNGNLISPDLMVFKGDRVEWIEAKHKSAFSWHRKTGTWQTGIDRRHWRDYLEVEKTTPFPVWLFFLHCPGGEAKDTPGGMRSPSGLFAGMISDLYRCIDHEHENHGPSGMVYWRESSLKKLAEYLEVSG